jgi:hypothetical protein
MECKYCKNTFTNISSLNKHIKYASYCISKRTDQIEENSIKFICDGCDKNFTSKYSLKMHIEICHLYTEKTIEKKYTLQLQEKDKIIEKHEKQIKEIKEKHEKQIKELQDKLENIAIKAVSRPRYFEDETTIEIDESDIDDSDIDESDIDESKSATKTDSEKYKLPTLKVGNGYIIEHREEDGFINVTNLCKAGKKQFSSWNQLEKTKGFLRVLSSSIGIHRDELIKYNTGSIKERATWAHPQVAINIAQWISPNFDVKVSCWVYEVMLTGKVDITNTKSYKELQKENKNKDLKIQFLTKKYVKSQPRVQYDEKNVIYILTTKLMKKERRYILGKTVDLTSRLSTYNKSDEHEVIFFASCKDVETMNIVENMVFSRLNEYREQANRERFVLPENEKIELFFNAIKNCIEFLK